MRAEYPSRLIVAVAFVWALLVAGAAGAQELPPDQNFNAELWEFTGPGGTGAARNVYKCTLCTFQQALDTPLPGVNWDKNISEGNRRLFFPSSTNIAPDVGPEIEISLDLVPEIEGDDHFLIAQVLPTVSFLGFGQQGTMALAMVRRDTTHTFSAGQVVHKVTSGEGTSYVMWSMEEQRVAAFNPFEVNGLAGMSVPNGWSYSSELLSEDFIVTTPGGVATVYSSPGWWNFQEIVPVPEPGTGLLVGLGLAAMGMRRPRAASTSTAPSTATKVA